MGHQEQEHTPSPSPRGLIVGNYCHDVLIKDSIKITSTLGGATSFISNVLDNLSITNCDYISKVGHDFIYEQNISHHPAIISQNSCTTLFHANFHSSAQNGEQDRVLKRVHACEAIYGSDLRGREGGEGEGRFEFGLAVGVGGEILPETLEKMVEICEVVFVDVQALIRVFDESEGGRVGLVELKKSGFYHLLPKIGFLKASAEEAVFIDVEEVRKWCCVVVTDGKDGCRVYWKDGEMRVDPFEAVQVDPTGAGDSFLGGFVGGLICKLNVGDAALVGNLFGSLTVAQIGVPKFDLRILQRVKEEIHKRTTESKSSNRRDGGLDLCKTIGHQDFHSSLKAAKLLTATQNEDSLAYTVGKIAQCQINGGPHILVNNVFKESTDPIESQP